jgi:ADP-heptose:LPS heptosyltransferase
MAKVFQERGNYLYHLIDRYAGIPLVMMGGLCRPKGSSVPRVLNKIGILKTACIGDTILLDAISKDLRNTWPQAKQMLFAGRDNCHLGHMLDEIDDVVVLPMHRPWVAAKKIYAAGRFDLWLDFSPWARIDALLTLMARAACKIGFSTPGQHRHYGYDFPVMHRRDVHEVENYRNLAGVAGISPQALPAIRKGPRPGVSPDLAPERPYIVLHMFPGGSRAHMKEWPRENWLKLAHFLLSEGRTVVFTGGPGDLSRAQALVECLSNKNQVYNLAGRLALSQLPGLLADSHLVISVNTGVMHMAAAVGARLIALHGPTSPQRWGPLSQNAVVIKPQNMPCSPCLHLGFEYKCNSNYCMLNIPVQAVIDAIRSREF